MTSCQYGDSGEKETGQSRALYAIQLAWTYGQVVRRDLKNENLKPKEKNSHFPYAKWSWHWDTPGVSGVTELIGKDVQKRWGVYTHGKPQSRGILQSKLLVSNLVSNPLNGGFFPNPSDSSVKNGFCFTLHVKKLMITTARAPHHQAQNFISLASSASATKNVSSIRQDHGFI